MFYNKNSIYALVSQKNGLLLFQPLPKETGDLFVMLFLGLHERALLMFLEIWAANFSWKKVFHDLLWLLNFANFNLSRTLSFIVSNVLANVCIST